MKIELDKNLVEMTPESEQEKESLTVLWNVLVDCVKFNRKMVPVGEYIPPKTTTARFAIED